MKFEPNDTIAMPDGERVLSRHNARRNTHQLKGKTFSIVLLLTSAEVPNESLGPHFNSKKTFSLESCPTTREHQRPMASTRACLASKFCATGASLSMRLPPSSFSAQCTALARTKLPSRPQLLPLPPRDDAFQEQELVHALAV